MVLRLGGKIKTRKNITTTNMVQIRITYLRSNKMKDNI